DINANDDLGMTFMESSSSEYLSMYVTGQTVFDTPGTVQTPVVTHPGTSNYTSTRAGDYAAITVDPNDGATVCAANEYKGNAYWNTGLACFNLSFPGPLGSAFASLKPQGEAPAETSSSSSSTAPVPADAKVIGIDEAFSAAPEKDPEVV